MATHLNRYSTPLSNSIQVVRRRSIGVAPENSELLNERWALSYAARAEANTVMVELEAAKLDRDSATMLTPLSHRSTLAGEQDNPASWSSVMDVWTWEDSILGSKLGANHRNTRMLLLQLDSEFMAVWKHQTDGSRGSVDRRRTQAERSCHCRWTIRWDQRPSRGGRGYVAGRLRRSEANRMDQHLDGPRYLGFDLPRPLLVTIPLLTILLSLSVSMSILAILSKPVGGPSTSYQVLQVFTTTRIFLVVLLFGIGTDFCLFLVSRCREGIQSKPQTNRRTLQRVIASSWHGVHDAWRGVHSRPRSAC